MNKGLKCINKNNTEKYIKNEEVENYLQKGWKLGMTESHKEKNSNSQKNEKSHVYNKKWMTKNDEEKRVFPNEININLENGWVFGRSKITNLKNSEKRKNQNNNRKWVNNGIEEKFIKKENFLEFINNGWKIGHLEETNKKISKKLKGNKHSDNQNKIISEFQKGKIVIHKENIEKRINKKDLKYYLIEGWKKGCSKKHNENNSKSQTGKNTRKLRIARIKQIKDNYGTFSVCYNRKACEFFKEFEEKYNLPKGRYALYGNGEFEVKELGYFLDYYNEKLKLIIEWDEDHHYDKNTNLLKKKDIKRQKEIQDYFPDFTFLRIKEKTMLDKSLNFEII